MNFEVGPGKTTSTYIIPAYKKLIVDEVSYVYPPGADGPTVAVRGHTEPTTQKKSKKKTKKQPTVPTKEGRWDRLRENLGGGDD